MDLIQTQFKAIQKSERLREIAIGEGTRLRKELQLARSRNHELVKSLNRVKGFWEGRERTRLEKDQKARVDRRRTAAIRHSGCLCNDCNIMRERILREDEEGGA